jgi:DNA-binding beta-propeller fold protein YncE
LIAASVALCSVLACGLAFLSAPALASGSSFGSNGSGEDQFNEPSGVAVNEATGHVYVVDKGNNRVEYFSAAGAYLGQFNGSAAPTGAFSSPEGIAVDNYSLSPSFGDVYVVDTGHEVIDKFSPSGTYLGQLTGAETPGASFSGKLGVALDRSGNLWVDEEDGTIYEFNDSDLFLTRIISKSQLSPGIALSAADHVYVLSAEHNVIFEEEEGIHPLFRPQGCDCDTGLALDQPTGDLYVDEGTRAAEYTGKGQLIQQFGTGELTGGAGIAVNSSSDTVYVADASASVVWIFPAPKPPPGIEECGGGGGAQPVDGGETLCAVVNPNGTTIEGCRLEFGETATYTQSFPCDPAPPYTESVQIEARLTGLRPGTTYHYRFALTDKNGTLDGPDHEFSTPPIPPTVNAESASGITQNDATLEATINPEDLERGAYYQFQLVREPSEYRSEIACPLRDELKATDGCQGPEVQGATIGYIPAGLGTQPVSVDAASLGLKLEPNTTYHYRVLAARKIQTEDTTQWETPPTAGPDQTFTTSSRARPLGGPEPEPTPVVGQPGASSPGGSIPQILPPSPGTVPPTRTVNPKPLTRAQKLAKALKQCQKEPKRKRAECKKQAHKKYAPAKRSSKKK